MIPVRANFTATDTELKARFYLSENPTLKANFSSDNVDCTAIFRATYRRQAKRKLRTGDGYAGEIFANERLLV